LTGSGLWRKTLESFILLNNAIIGYEIEEEFQLGFV